MGVVGDEPPSNAVSRGFSRSSDFKDWLAVPKCALQQPYAPCLPLLAFPPLQLRPILEGLQRVHGCQMLRLTSVTLVALLSIKAARVSGSVAGRDYIPTLDPSLGST